MPTRFLLVDDHALIREGLALALARVTEQVEVVEAGSCEQAMERLAADPSFDLIVLDMQLPGRSRLDAVTALRDLAPPWWCCLEAPATWSTRCWRPRGTCPGGRTVRVRLVCAATVFDPPPPRPATA
ncbi:MAG: response regulator [Myxococcales bacterium]|nr:response regulator [Myxococcales bacterium]